MDIVDRHTAQIRDDTHISNEIIVIENVPVKLGHLSIKWIIVTGPKCIGGEDTRLPGKFKGRTEVNVPTIGPHRIPSICERVLNLPPLKLGSNS